MAFRVEISLEAELDTVAILEWLIEREAGEAGFRWFIRLEDAIASLAELPERSPIAPENAKFPFEVRQLVYGRRPHLYRVLFTIRNNTVYVLRVRHGRRERVAVIN